MLVSWIAGPGEPAHPGCGGEGARASTYETSPTHDHIAAATADGEVEIWQLSSGKHVRTFPGFQETVRHIAYHPHGNIIAVAYSDYSIRLWDIPSGELRHQLVGHNGMITSISFSMHGNRIATASDDATTRIWSTKDGVVEKIIDTKEGRFLNAVFSPRRLELATADSRGGIQIWNAVRKETESLLVRSGSLTNLRICHGALEAVAVVPFPDPDTVWAPPEACSDTSPQPE